MAQRRKPVRFPPGTSRDAITHGRGNPPLRKDRPRTGNPPAGEIGHRPRLIAWIGLWIRDRAESILQGRSTLGELPVRCRTYRPGACASEAATRRSMPRSEGSFAREKVIACGESHSSSARVPFTGDHGAHLVTSCRHCRRHRRRVRRRQEKGVPFQRQCARSEGERWTTPRDQTARANGRKPHG